MAGRLESLRRALELEKIFRRVWNVFDISHSSGEATVASCVVFDGKWCAQSLTTVNSISRILRGVTITRRCSRLWSDGTKDSLMERGNCPIFCLSTAARGRSVRHARSWPLMTSTSVKVVGVAKGTTRKAGFETLIDADSGAEMRLRGDHPGLHLIQQIRDEAHRFAISGHRGQRAKARKQSLLEEIPGVGAKRRRELLRHFGSAKAIENASVEELSKIKGISAAVARTIYDHLHTVND